MVIKRRPIKKVDEEDKFEVIKGAVIDSENLNASQERALSPDGVLGSGGGTGSASGAQNKVMNNLSGYLTTNQPAS
jgi:hypothetical protein